MDPLQLGQDGALTAFSQTYPRLDDAHQRAALLVISQQPGGGADELARLRNTAMAIGAVAGLAVGFLFFRKK